MSLSNTFLFSFLFSEGVGSEEDGNNIHLPEDRKPEVSASSVMKRTGNKRNKVDYDNEAGSRAELLANDEMVWRPVHYVTMWQDVDLTHRVSVLLALPGGCAKNSKDIVLKVEDDGYTLMVKIKWPSLMCDIHKLHKRRTMKVGDSSDMALRQFGVKKELATLKEKADDDLVSVARIPLCIQVQEKVDNIELIADEAGGRVVYVDSKAPDSTYDTTAEKEFDFV